MEIDQRRHFLTWEATDPTLGRCAEILRMATRGFQSSRVPLPPARGMQQAQIELGVTDVEIRERRKVCVIVALNGHRHVHEIYAPASVFHRYIGHVYGAPQILWFNKVLISEAAITQVNAK